MYQPIYLDQNNKIVGVSKVVFSTEFDAKQYAALVCKFDQHPEIVELEVIR